MLLKSAAHQLVGSASAIYLAVRGVSQLFSTWPLNLMQAILVLWAYSDRDKAQNKKTSHKMSPNSRNEEIDYCQMGESAQSHCKQKAWIWVGHYLEPLIQSIDTIAKSQKQRLIVFLTFKVQDIRGYKYINKYLSTGKYLYLNTSPKLVERFFLVIRIQAIGKFGMNIWEVQYCIYLWDYTSDGIYLALEKIL